MRHTLNRQCTCAHECVVPRQVSWICLRHAYTLLICARTSSSSGGRGVRMGERERERGHVKVCACECAFHILTYLALFLFSQSFQKMLSSQYRIGLVLKCSTRQSNSNSIEWREMWTSIPMLTSVKRPLSALSGMGFLMLRFVFRASHDS